MWKSMMRENNGNVPSDHKATELKLQFAIAKGFNCHVCGSTDFIFNGHGMVFCNECAIAYQVDVLYNIYNT